ncbi:hypothetical protein NPIL_679601 [Nephila pilipes]|uniref:Uncharacterized protein n=1 Tax=Nephila pilipes TaxID=299642 RepID=A0A8X6UAI4_NEPPI|nr:hypothetical protein NPIL_679601 [Nephila pilipes]
MFIVQRMTLKAHFPPSQVESASLVAMTNARSAANAVAMSVQKFFSLPTRQLLSKKYLIWLDSMSVSFIFRQLITEILMTFFKSPSGHINLISLVSHKSFIAKSEQHCQLPINFTTCNRSIEQSSA